MIQTTKEVIKDTMTAKGKFTADFGFCVRGMFFSGTGTTEKIVTAVAEVISRTIDGEPEYIADAPMDFVIYRVPDYDFTPPAARKKEYHFGPRDIVVFGVPVIAGRVPNVLLPFLKTLDGGGALAVPVVLYGNRNFDDALIELRNILEEQGFHTVAGAAFIGEHSFSRVLAAGRPDEADLDVAVEFGKAVAEKIASLCRKAAEKLAEESDAQSGETVDGMEALGPVLEEVCPVEVDGQDPIRPYYIPQDRQGNHINILKVKPKVHEDKCTRCGICISACPMGSIRWTDKAVAVEGICIKCCGCEKKCPEGVFYFDDEGYLYHKTELELGYPDRKEPKLFV